MTDDAKQREINNPPDASGRYIDGWFDHKEAKPCREKPSQEYVEGWLDHQHGHHYRPAGIEPTTRPAAEPAGKCGACGKPTLPGNEFCSELCKFPAPEPARVDNAPNVADALRALVARLHAIHKNPKYLAVWEQFSIHGARYDGPQYTDELEAAEDALAAAEPAGMICTYCGHRRQADEGKCWSCGMTIAEAAADNADDEAASARIAAAEPAGHVLKPIGWVCACGNWNSRRDLRCVKCCDDLGRINAGLDDDAEPAGDPRGPKIVYDQGFRDGQQQAADDLRAAAEPATNDEPRKENAGMLVLSRKIDEIVMIGDDIEVKILDIRGDKVRVGIAAPREIEIHRKEVYDTIQAGRKEAEVTTLGKLVRCPNCNMKLSAFDDLEDPEAVPAEGDTIICIGCAMALIVTDDLGVRAPTPAENIALSQNPRVHETVQAIRELNTSRVEKPKNARKKGG